MAQSFRSKLACGSRRGQSTIPSRKTKNQFPLFEPFAATVAARSALTNQHVRSRVSDRLTDGEAWLAGRIGAGKIWGSAEDVDGRCYTTNLWRNCGSQSAGVAGSQLLHMTFFPPARLPAPIAHTYVAPSYLLLLFSIKVRVALQRCGACHSAKIPRICPDLES